MVATSHHSLTLTISRAPATVAAELQSDDRIRRDGRGRMLQHEPPTLLQIGLLCQRAAFGEIHGIQRCQSERGQGALDRLIDLSILLIDVVHALQRTWAGFGSNVATQVLRIGSA